MKNKTLRNSDSILAITPQIKKKIKRKRREYKITLRTRKNSLTPNAQSAVQKPKYFSTKNHKFFFDKVIKIIGICNEEQKSALIDYFATTSEEDNNEMKMLQTKDDFMRFHYYSSNKRREYKIIVQNMHNELYTINSYKTLEKLDNKLLNYTFVITSENWRKCMQLPIFKSLLTKLSDEVEEKNEMKTLVIKNSKPRMTRKGDKQSCFFNEPQTRFFETIANFIKNLTNYQRKLFIFYLTILAKNSSNKIDDIEDESDFMRFYKHLKKRSNITHRIIVQVKHNHFTILKSYKDFMACRSDSESLFLVITNENWINFKEMPEYRADLSMEIMKVILDEKNQKETDNESVA